MAAACEVPQFRLADCSEGGESCCSVEEHDAHSCCFHAAIYWGRSPKFFTVFANDFSDFLDVPPGVQCRPFCGLLAFVKMLQRLECARGASLLRWRGQVCHSDTISALSSRVTANCDVLSVNTARLTMLRMSIDAELT